MAICFGPSRRVFDIDATKNPSLKYSLHPIPQLPVDPSRGERETTWGSYWVEGVNSKSENSAAAWELIKFLSSKEVMPKLYEAAKNSGRAFGEPYSRVDLADQLTGDSFIGPYITQAPLARSWYLASSTFDGDNGLNTRLSQAYAAVINKTSSVTVLATEVNKILSQYGLAPALPVAP